LDPCTSSLGAGTTVENCLRLSTLQAVHHFPLHILDNHMNTDCLSVSGVPQIPKSPGPSYPQLKLLEVTGIDNLVSFNTWAKQHIVKLQLLKYPCDQTILELFDNCLDTLNILDLSLRYGISGELSSQFWDHVLNASDYCTTYNLGNEVTNLFYLGRFGSIHSRTPQQLTSSKLLTREVLPPTRNTS